jgi:antitoxin HigA-1
MLLEESLTPYDMTQTELADRLGISFVRVNKLIKGKRGMIADTALRPEQLFGTEAQFWMNLQLRWYPYAFLHSPDAAEITRIRPFKAAV